MAQWNPHEWIGTGKTYPTKDTPHAISAARAELLVVPEEYRCRYPDRALSISELLDKTLLVQSSVLATVPAHSCFRVEPPNEDLTILDTRSIPPLKWIRDAITGLGQAWFDGAQSIVDWRYQHSRLPFWVLTYWQTMADVISHRARWKAR